MARAMAMYVAGHGAPARRRGAERQPSSSSRSPLTVVVRAQIGEEPDAFAREAAEVAHAHAGPAGNEYSAIDSGRSSMLYPGRLGAM